MPPGIAGGSSRLSRRGLIPRAHADFDAGAGRAGRRAARQCCARLWRWLRHRGAEVGWRAAIDALRPHSQPLWQGLPPEEQQRFLRHARPWWDVHRHRIAPEVAAALARAWSPKGGSRSSPGGSSRSQDDGDGLDGRVSPARRHVADRRGALRLRVQLHRTAAHHFANPRSTAPQLLDDGLVRPDQLGIGARGRRAFARRRRPSMPGRWGR